MDIKTVRQKYPQYNDLSDEQLAEGLYKKYYSDLPRTDFYSRLGFEQAPPINAMEVTKGLKTGYEQVKMMPTALGLQMDTNKIEEQQGLLSAFDKIDRGEQISPTDTKMGIRDFAQVKGYQTATPEERERIRQSQMSQIKESALSVDEGLKLFEQFKKETAQYAGKTPDLTDVDSASAFADWLSYNFGAAAPQVVPMVVAAYATRGRSLPFAFSASMGAQESVSNRLDYIQDKTKDLPEKQRVEETIKYLQDTGTVSTLTGLGVGALDLFGPVGSALRRRVAEEIAKRTGKEAAEEKARTGFKGALKDVPRDILEEAMTGAAQSLLQIGSEQYLGEQTGDVFSGENIKRIINDAAAEAAGGIAGSGVNLSTEGGKSLYKQRVKAIAEKKIADMEAPEDVVQKAIKGKELKQPEKKPTPDQKTLFDEGDTTPPADDGGPAGDAGTYSAPGIDVTIPSQDQQTLEDDIREIQGLPPEDRPAVTPTSTQLPLTEDQPSADITTPPEPVGIRTTEELRRQARSLGIDPDAILNEVSLREDLTQEQFDQEYESTIRQEISRRLAQADSQQADSPETPKPDVTPADEQTPQDTTPETVFPEDAQGLPEGTILQNRERSSPNSVKQMNEIANAPDYYQAAFSNSFTDGAPVIFGATPVPKSQLGRKGNLSSGKTKDKIPVQYAVIESTQAIPSNNVDGTSIPNYADLNIPGFRAVTNGRLAGLQEGYRRNTMAQYKKDLMSDDIHGIDPAVIGAMKNPLLVRIMPQNLVTKDIADISNTSSGLGFSATETAKNDANRIDLNGLQFRDDGGVSAETVKGFVALMPQTEQQELIDKQGRPTKKAYDRLNAAIFSKAYQNDDIISLAVEAKDEEARNIISALTQAAPQMAALPEGDYDVRPAILEATELAINARRNNQQLKDVIAQQDIVSQDPVSREIMQLYANNPRSAKKIGEGLKRIADAANTEAAKSLEPDMLGDVPTRRPLIDVVAEAAVEPQSEGDLFAEPPAAPEVQISPEQQKKEALDKFKGILGQVIPPFRAQYASGRIATIRPKELTAQQTNLILDLVGSAIDLGMPAVLLERVTAAGSTRMDSIAGITYPKGHLVTGKQWASSSKAQQLATLIHEIGHATDYKSSSDPVLSGSDTWTSAHEELKAWYEKNPIAHPLVYPFAPQFEKKVRIRQESFAQAFALYFTSPKDLQSNAPDAYSQINDIVQGVQNESRPTQAAGTQTRSPAKVDVQQSGRSESGAAIQPGSGAIVPSLSSAARSQDRGARVTARDSSQEGSQDIPLRDIDPSEVQTVEDLQVVNANIREQKISEYQSVKRRLSEVQRRRIRNEARRLDDVYERSLYEAAETLKAEIEMSQPERRTPEDFMARAAKALADGDISKDVYDVIDAMFKKNPALLNGLRLSVRAGRDNSAGQFIPLIRMVKLFKGYGAYNPSTVRHEVTHSMEQMMSPEARAKVIDEWRKAVAKAKKANQSEQAKKFFQAVENFIANPSADNYNATIETLPSYEYYQFVNPSEYWAVNAEKLMQAYLGSGWQRFKSSMKGFLEAIKKVLGLKNTHAIYSTFNDLITKPRGRESTTMLVGYMNENVPIMDTKRRNYAGNQAPPATFETPPSAPSQGFFSKLNKTDFRYNFQNKMIDLKDTTKAIKESGKTVEDVSDANTKETLYYGRVSNQVKEFERKELVPALKKMQKLKVRPEEIGAYMLAKHAPERNAHIANINPSFPDEGPGTGGSGITTAEANAYLETLSPERRQQLESVSSDIQNIILGTQDIEVKGGLEQQATIDVWREMWPDYVPLFRSEIDYVNGGSGMGQGFDTRGSSSKRAVGSSRDIKDIFSSVIEQRERAIVRSEKNRVVQGVYALSIQNPNAEWWLPINPDAVKNKGALIEELDKFGISPQDAENYMSPPKVATVVRVPLPNGGYHEQVQYRVSSNANFSDNVIGLRVNGKNRYVIFNPNNERAKRLASSLKNLDAEQLDFVTKNVGNVTRFIASMSTQYNPIFGLWNFTRDIQSAALNLSTTPLKGKQAVIIADAFKMLPSMYKEYRATRDGRDIQGEVPNLLREFLSEGAQSGYRQQFEQLTQRGTIVERELAKLNAGNVRSTVTSVANWLSDYNDVLENAIRLSVYKQAKKMGMTNQQAASLAKEITVNFNRKGAKTPGLSALYAFFNAAVQGTDRMIDTLTGPAGKKIIAGGMLLGVVQALILEAAGFEEDEPTAFLKEKNLIIPIGDGDYLMWPMPLGFNFLPNMGRILTEMTLGGKKKARDRVGELMAVMVDSFNPLGGAGFMQTISPTVLDPFVAVEENKDAFGRPISREDFATNPKPGYLRSRQNATGYSKLFAEAINSMAGGTEFTPGLISPTGDALDYIVGQYLGGVGREVQRMYELGKSQATGEELETYRIPLFGKIYGKTDSPAATAARFYSTVTRMAEHEQEIKGRRDQGRDPRRYIAENPESRMYKYTNNMENKISKINRKIKDLYEKQPDDPRIEQLNERKTILMELYLDNMKKRFPD